MPRRRSSATASRRAAGLGVCGSVARQASSSRVGTERLTETGSRFAIRSKISTSRIASGDLVRTETGVSRLLQRREDLRHHPVAALDPLVGIGVRPQRHQLPLPARPRQLRPQQLRHVDLDDDLALEVPAGIEVEIGVGASGEAENAGMSAAPVRVDRPAEPEAAAGHVVQRRAGADLVEVDPHRLRRVEGADDGAVADSRQPQVVLDSLLVPAHEHMFAYVADGTDQGAIREALEAGAGLVALEGLELAEGFGAGFGAQRRQQGDQVAVRRRGPAWPSGGSRSRRRGRRSGRPAKRKLAWMSLTTGRPVEKV